MNPSAQYVIGIDFGTLSGRAVVVRVADGEEIAGAVHEYRHGVLERSLDVGDAHDDGAPGERPEIDSDHVLRSWVHRSIRLLR